MKINCKKVIEFHKKDGSHMALVKEDWELEQYRSNPNYIEKTFLEIHAIQSVNHYDDLFTDKHHLLNRKEITTGALNYCHYIHFMDVTYMYIESMDMIVCVNTDIDI